MNNRMLFIFFALIGILGISSGCVGADDVEKPTESEIVAASSIPSGVDEVALYEKFIQSRQWAAGEADLPADITAYTIFDFDGDGIQELWLEAYDETGPQKSGISGFYSIKNAQVEQLLRGTLSGGSIGGEEIVICYDTVTEKHLIGLDGFYGGFDGSAHSSVYYEYKKGDLHQAISGLMLSQAKENYSAEELEDEALYYVESNEFKNYITVYEVDDVRVRKDIYEETMVRLTEPLDEKYIMKRKAPLALNSTLFECLGQPPEMVAHYAGDYTEAWAWEGLWFNFGEISCAFTSSEGEVIFSEEPPYEDVSNLHPGGACYGFLGKLSLILDHAKSTVAVAELDALFGGTGAYIAPSDYEAGYEFGALTYELQGISIEIAFSEQSDQQYFDLDTPVRVFKMSVLENEGQPKVPVG